MMDLAKNVNVSDCLTRGFERMKALLFPFDLLRWITLGFCAWLIGAGQGGSVNLPDFKDFGGEESEEGLSVLDSLYILFWGEGSLSERLAAGFDVSPAMVQLFLWGGAFVVIIGIAITIIVAYFQARIRFVWLDNLLWKRSLIRVPYAQYKEQGGEFFKGKLIVDIGYYLLLLVAVSGCAVPFVLYLRESARVGDWGGMTGGMIAGIAVFLLFSLVNIFFMAYYKLACTFIPLIVCKKNMSFWQALGEFNNMLKQRLGQFVKFLLFSILLGIALGVLCVMLILCCCCLLLPLGMPIIGATMLLPWHVMMGYYTIEFFETLTGEPVVWVNEPEDPSCEPVMAELVEPGV